MQRLQCYQNPEQAPPYEQHIHPFFFRDYPPVTASISWQLQAKTDLHIVLKPV
jgi:hypothetical protein